MKKLVLLLFFPFICIAQSDKNSCKTLFEINKFIQENHYKSKPLDDSLSVYVFNTFLEEIDEDNRLFTEIEIDALKKYQYKIDDLIIDQNCEFINAFYDSYTIAIERYKTSVEAITKEPFANSSSEKMEFSLKRFPYSKNETELKRFLKKRILFNVLKDVSQISKNKDSIISNFDGIFKLSKVKIFDLYLCKYSGLKISENDFKAKLYNSFCSYFDPHTMYLSEGDKSSFLSNVSADNLSFGMIVSMNENDEIIVDEVIPGSSAYFTEKINDGDQLLKVKYNNEEYTIACASLSKIGEIFTSSEFKKADFTFKKKNNETYTVTLTKKVIKDYENNVYSYILEKENKKTGYIKIPSFYATFENGKTNVSDDVAKEIYKLKEDNIDGLILDLQNNGGGSMDEAIKLTGFFIDIGPIAIMNTKSGKKQTIKDPNRGSIYNGSIVILTNGLSASASEFFANAMQDYNRAIIVGNPSYGKATMQQIFPLSIDKNKEEYLKLTIEQFYRITGKTNQIVGTIPDIELPTLYDAKIPRENKSLTALKNDAIDAILRFTPFVNPKKDDVIQKSKTRVNATADFKMILDLNLKIDKLYNNDLLPIELNISSVFDSLGSFNKLWDEIKKVTEAQYDLKVESSSVNVEYQQFDEFLKSNNIEKIKAIKNNLHIIEAVTIINDLKQ